MRFGQNTVQLCLVWMALSGCQTESMQLGSKTPDQAQTVLLTTQRKRIVRQDCRGKVVSDLLEATGPARVTMALPTGKNPSTTKLYNATTNSRARCLVDQKIFTISNITESCSMLVRPGINELHYRFDYCAQSSCSVPSESGIMYLHVVHEKNTVGGIEVVSDCSAAAKPDLQAANFFLPLRN